LAPVEVPVPQRLHTFFQSIVILAAAAVGASVIISLSPDSLDAASGDVVTYHADNARTGQYLNETTLTPASVAVATFGKVGFFAVDGKVDAQPLYLSGLSIPGQGIHDVLLVATEHDTLYALDAVTGATLWSRSLLGTGESPSDGRGCSQVVPEIGITSTPVIDRVAGAIYVVSMSKNASGAYFQRLHALNITTGAELFGGPKNVQAAVPGTGAGGVNGTVTFDPKQYEERAALLLLNGSVMTTWTSHCDIDPYTGWIMFYSAATLAQTSVLNVTPNGSRGAFWMAGSGPAADPQGNVYILAGNGTFDTTLNAGGFPNQGNFGNAFLKLSTSAGLRIADYFATFDTVSKSSADSDLGSGGVVVLPDLVDSASHVRHLAAGAGKDGHIYLADRDAMGKWNAGSNANLYQDVTGALSGGAWSTPAYFNGKLYYAGVGDKLKAFPLVNARVVPTPSSVSARTFAYPGATPSISASGGSNAIVWAVENSNPAVLHAYDALDLSHELYNSNQAASGRDAFGPGNKFITPIIANGRVYVGTTAGVAVFGLLAGVPSVVGVTPRSGTGSSQTFALRYADSAGATDLSSAIAWFTASATSAAGSCVVLYNRGANAVSLLDDAGSQWTTRALGIAGTLQNSQCTITLGSSTTVVASGNTLTWNLAVAFAPAFGGTKAIYMMATTDEGAATDLQAAGTWTIPGGPVVTAVSVTPSSGSGSSGAFTFQYGDTAGATDISSTFAWFATTTVAGSCLVRYDKAANTISLLNDAATQWTTGTLGVAGTIQNSRCSVTLGSSTTVVPVGNVLLWHLAMMFKPAFTGTKAVDMYAENGQGVASGLQLRGLWTVP
jgi:hypothetical protein